MRIVPFLLALGLAVGGAAVPALVPTADPPVDDGAVTVSAAPTQFGLLRPGQNLQVNGVVRNTTSQTTEAGTATVFLSSTPVSSRSAMTQWLAPDDDAPTPALGTSVGTITIDELAPGQVRPFTVTIPATGIDLAAHAFAVFPLSVRLMTGDIELDIARSAVVWSPDQNPPTTSLAVAMPILAPAGTTGLINAADLTTYTAPDGVLTTQLATALTHRVAIGIDPMILASIRVLGTSAPPSALDWLAQLAAAQNETFALSYADSDLALIGQAGGSSELSPLTFPIDPSLFAPAAEEAPSPTETPPPEPSPPLPTPDSLVEWAYTIKGLTWPSDGSVVEKDLDAFAAMGMTRTILSSSQVTGESVESNGAIGDHAVTVSDSAVSGYLRTAANATTELDWQSAMASLTAELAASAARSGTDIVFATLGRDGSATGPRLSETLDAIAAWPWLRPATLGDAIRSPVVPMKFTPSPEPATRIATATELLASEQQVTAFSSVLLEPTALTGPRRLALLATLAQSWHSDQSGWNQAAARYLADNATTLASVRIPDSSPITLLQEKSNLPIAVKNELAFPVTVYLTVQPERAILDVVDDRVELTIEANSQAKALVPVQSIANGQVRTTVLLSSATGVAISQPTVVELNVQAGWETAATVVLAVIVVALFVAGVWRTIRRRRRLRKLSEKASG